MDVGRYVRLAAQKTWGHWWEDLAPKLHPGCRLKGPGGASLAIDPQKENGQAAAQNSWSFRRLQVLETSYTFQGVRTSVSSTILLPS